VRKGLAFEDPHHFQQIDETIRGAGFQLAGDDNKISGGQRRFSQDPEGWGTVQNDVGILRGHRLAGPAQHLFPLGAHVQGLGNPRQAEVGGGEVETWEVRGADHPAQRQRWFAETRVQGRLPLREFDTKPQGGMPLGVEIHQQARLAGTCQGRAQRHRRDRFPGPAFMGRDGYCVGWHRDMS